jgi:CheY-like chemotaxis protein
MTRLQPINETIPALRRYARALTGDQSSGDAYVAATLETIAEDPSVLDAASHPKVALFRAFTGIWNSIRVNGDKAPPQLAAERRLERMTPKPRQAFLLVSMEAFTEQQASEVLGVTLPELRKLVDESGRELASEIATEVLIIEDEPMIAMELESLVERLGHKVLGIATTHKEAVALAEKGRPGLILADIQLADMSSGLEAVNEVLLSINVPVIFITAYPEQFLTGQRPEPTFLITKPFAPAMVSAVVSQALFFEQKAKSGLEQTA